MGDRASNGGAGATNRARRPRRLPRANRYFVACLSAALVAGLVVSSGSLADSVVVTPTSVTLANANGSTLLTGTTISGYSNSTEPLLVSVSTTLGSLSMSETSGLVLSYGYSTFSGSSFSFVGDQSDVQNGLASLTLTGSGTTGTASVGLSVTANQTGIAYLPATGHYYEFVANTTDTWTQADAAAPLLSFAGQNGYLASIPTATVNTFVQNHLNGAQNVWAGGMSVDYPSGEPGNTSVHRVWSWQNGPLAGTVFTQCSNISTQCAHTGDTGDYYDWNTGEPNNSGYLSGTPGSGEHYVEINYLGTGNWNDIANSTTIAGYVAEFGTNATGGGFTGSYSGTANVTLATPPGQPTGVTAAGGSSGGGSATVSWLAPSNTGGTPITGYTVTASGGAGTCTTSSALSCTITGLANAASYTFTVTATNAEGTSSASSASSSTTVSGAPAIPTSVSATAGAAQATVSWTAASGDGSTITGYTATASPGGRTCSWTSGATSCTVTGLTNGASYTFTVTATNANGTGAPSSPSSAVTPLGVAGAPTAVSAVGTSVPGAQATVSWSAPASNGGSSITGYTVTASGGAGSCTTTGALSCTVTGLTNGSSYTFTVVATNGQGSSSPSSASSSTAISGAPAIPTGVTAVAGAGQATVSWTASSSNGSAVTGYTVTASPGGQRCTWTSGATSCTVTGLTDGTSYTFKVSATNADGTSLRSTASSSVTPLDVPGPPTGVSADGASVPGSQATVTWSAPVSNGGSTITGYTVTASGGAGTCYTGGSLSCTVTGLTDGSSYTFTVIATNAQGNSAPSGATGSTIVIEFPHAPVIQTPADGTDTNVNEPTFSGTGEAESTVTIYVAGAAVGTAPVDGKGNWSFTPSSPIADGTYSYDATVTDSWSNVSPASPSESLTIDTVAPSAPVVQTPADGTDTNVNEPVFSGTAEVGSMVTVYADGSAIGFATTDGSANWSFTPSSVIADGTYTIDATATDAAGNVSQASTDTSLTIDTVAPDAPVVQAPVDGTDTNVNEPTFSGVAEAGSTVTIYVDGSSIGTAPADNAGNWAFTPASVIADGTYTFDATATDAAGNISEASASESLTIDTVAPDAPVLTTPASGTDTNVNEPVFSGTAEAGSMVTVYADDSEIGTATTDGSGNWSFTPSSVIADGTYTIDATATDAAGNVSEASVDSTLTIDTVAPDAPAVISPANGTDTNVNEPVFSGTAEAGSTITVYLDDSAIGTAPVDDSGDWSFTPSSVIADGTYTVDATATDAAGNTSDASADTSLTIDTVAPDAPVVQAPVDGTDTNVNEPGFSGVAEAGSTVTVYVDGSSIGTTQADNSGDWAFTPTSVIADGTYTFDATATDAAGNVSEASASESLTIDTVAPDAPVLTTPASGTDTNVNEPVFSGTAEAGSMVTVYADDSEIGTAATDNAGNWSFTPSSPIADGTYTIDATATDAAGNVSQASVDSTLTIDTVAPAAPVVTTPASGTDTNVNEPVFSGTAEAGSTITVYLDDSAIGTAATDNSGNWSFTPSSVIADGTYTVDATATDAAGNTSDASTDTSLTIDTVAPAAPVVATPLNNADTNINEPTFAGTAEAGSTVTVYLDGSEVGTALTDNSGDWSFAPSSAIADGTYTVDATATDAAGNVSQASTDTSLTIDTVAPDAPAVISPANGTDTHVTEPTFSGTAEAGSTVAVYLDGSPVGTALTDNAGDWSFVPSSAIADGTYTVDATATDVAGNTSQASTETSLTIDTVAPDAPAVISPANGTDTNVDEPTFSGTAEAGSTVAVYLDGFEIGTAPVDNAGDWAFTPSDGIADGTYTVDATATDAAGNTSQASTGTSLTIDTVAPAAPVVATPLNNADTNIDEPTFAGTAEAGSTVTVYVGGSEVGTALTDNSGDWEFAPSSPIADGTYTVDATATDAAGNTSQASTDTSLTIDTVAPDAPAVISPANGTDTNVNEPTFSGTAEAGSTVTIYLDDSELGTALTDNAGDWSFAPSSAIADGTYTVDATATDAAGNTSQASTGTSLTIDTVIPDAPVVTSPANGSVSNDVSPTVTVTGEADTNATVEVDGADYGPVPLNGSGTGQVAIPGPLSAGQHSVRARLADADGNVSAWSATSDWTVKVSTSVQLTGPTAGPTNAVTPTVSYIGEAGDEYVITVDGQTVLTGVIPAGGSGSVTMPSALSDGVHTIAITVTDQAGNQASASIVVTIDTVAPGAVTVVSAPAAITNSTSATFSFSDDKPGVVYQCSLDGNTWATCASPVTFSGLSDGPHSLLVRAVDPAGNVSPTSQYAWTIDTTPPPPPEILGRLAAVSTPGPMTFVFSTTPDTTLECSLDGAPFEPCPAQYTVGTLPLGPHTLDVRAVDEAGDISQSSSYHWTVMRSRGPLGMPHSAQLTIASSATASGARYLTVGCNLNAGSVERCTVTAYYHGRVIGSGTTAVAKRGSTHTIVTVSLNAAGRRLLARAIAGLPVTLRGAARPFGFGLLAANTHTVMYQPLRFVIRDLIFKSTSSDLTPRANTILRAIAHQLRGAKTIVCEGDTDSLGSYASNYALGLHRAQAVCAMLRRLGVRAHLSAMSYGDERPVASNRTAAGRDLNRRVVIRVSY